MFCIHCGAEVSDQMRFCPKCGARLKDDRPIPEPEPEPKPQPEPTVQTAPVAQPEAVPQEIPQPSQPLQIPAQPAPMPDAAPVQPSKKRPPLAAIVAGILVVAALIGLGVWMVLGRVDPNALDEYGNPTLHAFVNLEGEELCTLLEGKGWTWDEEKLWFASSDGNANLYADAPEGHEYTYDDFQGMQAFGGNEPVVYALRVAEDSYPTTADAMSALVPESIEIDEVKWIDEEQTRCIITFNGSIAELFLNEDKGSYYLIAFNPAALERGMFIESSGNVEGRSADEIWRNLFGHVPGGEPASYPEDAVDAYGNPTLNAFVNLTGDELCDMLAEEGWSWDAESTSPAYFNGDKHVSLENGDGNGYSREEIRDLPAFGIGEHVEYNVSLGDDYSSLEEFVSSFAPNADMIDDIGWLNEDKTRCIVAFHNESGEAGLALMVVFSNGTEIGVTICNPEAIAQGAFEAGWGEDVGRSIDDIWHFLFGRTPGEEAAANPAEAFDASGIPTLYALTELDGAQLCDMLVSEAWWWDSDKLWFNSPDDLYYVYAYGPDDYECTYGDLRALSTFGMGEPVEFDIMAAASAYSSTEEALSALVPEPVVIDAIEWSDNGQSCIFVFHGSSEEKSIAEVWYDSPNYVLSVFNPDALAQGMFTRYWGEDVGTSADEIWNNIFGHAPGA